MGAEPFSGLSPKGDLHMAEAIAYFRGNFVPLSEAKVSVMTHALH